MPDLPAPLASLWRRAGARLVDLAIAAVVVLVPMVVAGGSVVDRFQDRPMAYGVAQSLLNVAYELVFTTVLGGTLGKQALGLRVVDEATGRYPVPLRSLVRAVVPLAGSLLRGFASLLVYGPALFDDRKRGLHDRAARTTVVLAGAWVRGGGDDLPDLRTMLRR